MSKIDYLKKYMTLDKHKSKKSKKEKIFKTNFRIFDEDIVLKDLQQNSAKSESEEEMPVIADLIDDRTEMIKQIEKYRSNNKWKVLENSTDNSNMSKESVILSDYINEITVPKNEKHKHGLNKKKYSRNDRVDSDNDLSPKRKSYSNDFLSNKNNYLSNGTVQRYNRDLSPRQKSEHDEHSMRKNLALKTKSYFNEDQSHIKKYIPTMKVEVDSDNDLSSRLKSSKDNFSHNKYLPIVKGENDSDADISPRRKSHFNEDFSRKDLPIMKIEQDSDNDLSPKRKSCFNTQNVDRKKISSNFEYNSSTSSFKSSRIKTEHFRKQNVDTESLKETSHIYKKWQSGIKQQEMQNNKIQEMTHEIDKPLARYSDDKDLDEYLRQVEKPDDPMLEYMRKKKKVPTATLR